MNAASPSPCPGSRPAASPSPSPAEAPARPGTRPLPSCEHRQRGDEFERVLRQKSAASRDDEPGGDTADGKDDPAGGVAALLPFCPPPPPALQAAKPAPAALGAPRAADPNATQAALGSALSADPGTPAATGLRADAASAWEVTLNDPRGVAVELRAARPAGIATADRPANWTLTIASPVQDAALLARHVPRLNERLRARALTHAHVRIEDGDEHSD